MPQILHIYQCVYSPKQHYEADIISKPILQMRKWKHGKFNQPVLSYTACKQLIEILTQQPVSPDPARGSGSTPVKLNTSLSVLSCNSRNIILFLWVITGTRLCKTIQSLILIFCSQGVTSYRCGKIRIYVLSSISSSPPFNLNTREGVKSKNIKDQTSPINTLSQECRHEKDCTTCTLGKVPNVLLNPLTESCVKVSFEAWHIFANFLVRSG